MVDIANLIKTTLSIPVQTGISVLLTPKCAVYEVYSLGVGLAGDGDEEEELFNHQIDLFYKDSTQASIHTDAKTLKAAIISNIKTTIPAIDYSYDTTNHYWRATITFTTTEE